MNFFERHNLSMPYRMKRTDHDVVNLIIMDNILKQDDENNENGCHSNTFTDLVDVFCVDCGRDLFAVHPKTMRCPECAYKKKRTHDLVYKQAKDATRRLDHNPID